MTARQPARAVFFQTAPQRTGAGFGGGRLNTDSGSAYIPPAPRQTAQTAAAFPDTAGRTKFFDFLFAAIQENACRAHFISERPVIE
jgi:hypothetical protein